MYDVQILVNGSRCKQYNHDGKIFIESKHDSEYTIEIKHDSWKRILAVCSVDGLDILNGKPATENGNGYVINQLSATKFDGFRVSDEKVAKFVFTTKDGSYAASKEDSSEKNVGVIGVRIFQEKLPPPPVVKEIHHHHNNWQHQFGWGWWDKNNPPLPYNPPIWCDTTYGTAGTTCDMVGDDNVRHFSSLCNNGTNNLSNNISAKTAVNCSSILREVKETPRGFDMGTKWGEAKESRVIEVEFEKGILAFTKNIYYASRQSLIEMGVPLGNEKQVSFPEPFTEKYATPPKGWKA